ncbi:hypothetical protein [Celeribacter baekdonensis]|nr:hypothetical protein [Celeribacter baekdonensis]
MHHIVNTGETMLLEGRPLSLVTPAGIEDWTKKGIPHRLRYDQVRDPRSGNLMYRCLYEKVGGGMPYVLVSDPDTGDGGFVILFERLPDSEQ